MHGTCGFTYLDKRRVQNFNRIVCGKRGHNEKFCRSQTSNTANLVAEIFEQEGLEAHKNEDA